MTGMSSGNELCNAVDTNVIEVEGQYWLMYKIQILNLLALTRLHFYEHRSPQTGRSQRKAADLSDFQTPKLFTRMT